MARKLLKRRGLAGIYRNTGRYFAFYRGGGGGKRGRGRGRGRGSGEVTAVGGQAKLRAATGEARGLHRFGQDQKQKPYHIGYGGVVVGRNLPRLAVEFGIDGYSDVSEDSHGHALQKCSGISLYLVVCIKER